MSKQQKVLEVINDIDNLVQINYFNKSLKDEMEKVKAYLTEGSLWDAKDLITSVRDNENNHVSDLAQIDMTDVEIKIYDLMLEKKSAPTV